MGVLGDRRRLAGRVRVGAGFKLNLDLQMGRTKPLGAAEQMFTFPMILGFGHKGPNSFILRDVSGARLLRVDSKVETAVADVDDTHLGRIIHAPDGGLIVDAKGEKLGTVGARIPDRHDDEWVHPVHNHFDNEVGTITRIRKDPTQPVESLGFGWLMPQALPPQHKKATGPSFGVVLTLKHTVPDLLGDMLVAACIDIALVPRGYVSLSV